MEIPRVPPEIIEKIKLKEPQIEKWIMKVIFDKKQFSLKLPKKIALELGLKEGDKFEATIEPNVLKLKLLR